MSSTLTQEVRQHALSLLGTLLRDHSHEISGLWRTMDTLGHLYGTGSLFAKVHELIDEELPAENYMEILDTIIYTSLTIRAYLDPSKSSSTPVLEFSPEIPETEDGESSGYHAC